MRDMPHIPPWARLTFARRSLAGLVGVCCLGVALGACTKCDVPNWYHPSPAPQSCHDGPDPQ